MHAVALARAVDGAVLLSAPGLVTDTVSSDAAGTLPHLLARALGARQLTEAALALRLDSPRWIAIRAAVDAAHAATMLGLARARPRSRRLALASAALASSFAGAGLLDGVSRWRACRP